MQQHKNNTKPQNSAQVHHNTQQHKKKWHKNNTHSNTTAQKRFYNKNKINHAAQNNIKQSHMVHTRYNSTMQQRNTSQRPLNFFKTQLNIIQKNKSRMLIEHTTQTTLNSLIAITFAFATNILWFEIENRKRNQKVALEMNSSIFAATTVQIFECWSFFLWYFPFELLWALQ